VWKLFADAYRRAGGASVLLEWDAEIPSFPYSPFGYRSWGYYDPYYYRGPGVIIINPGDGGDVQPSGDGRVVDGRGYTRIRRNQPEPATRTGSGGSSRGTSSTSDGNSGSSSGTSGVSSGGYSSGGASSGSGRTAVPRPPG
jgi:hypothetical protein